MLFIVIGVLVALFAAAGWIDFKARRRGVRYRGVDRAAQDQQALNEAELNMRSNGRLRDMRGGGTGWDAVLARAPVQLRTSPAWSEQPDG